MWKEYRHVPVQSLSVHSGLWQPHHTACWWKHRKKRHTKARGKLLLLQLCRNWSTSCGKTRCCTLFWATPLESQCITSTWGSPWQLSSNSPLGLRGRQQSPSLTHRSVPLLKAIWTLGNFSQDENKNSRDFFSQGEKHSFFKEEALPCNYFKAPYPYFTP